VSSTRPPFGSCCKALREALTLPHEKLLRVSDDGRLFLAVGYVMTEDGAGWFEELVGFCPFCGASLQERPAAKLD
jgi:hypothetical protein